MTSETIKEKNEIYLRFSPASPRFLQSFSKQLFHFPHYYVHGKKKKQRESEFDQKHNFRDVIGSRTCADRFRCFSIYRGNTCAMLLICFFSLSKRITSLRNTRHYRDDTVSSVANFVCDYSRKPPQLPTSIHPLPLVK